MTAPTDPASGKHLFNSTGIDGADKTQEVQVRSQIFVSTLQSENKVT